MQLRLDFDGERITRAVVSDDDVPVLDIAKPTARQIVFLHRGCAAPALLAACQAARGFVDPAIPGASRMFAALDAAIALAEQEGTTQ